MAGRRASKATLEREAKVVEMRDRRMTFDEIAAELGVSQTRAVQLYKNALTRYPAQKIEEHRASEERLIDKAIEDLLKIIDRCYEQNTWQGYKNAIDAWGKIRDWSERKSKLLGLDAPTKTITLTITQIDNEIRQAEQTLRMAGVDVDAIDVEFFEENTPIKRELELLPVANS